MISLTKFVSWFMSFIQLYQHVVLSGGSTMFPGLPSRWRLIFVLFCNAYLRIVIHLLLNVMNLSKCVCMDWLFIVMMCCLTVKQSRLEKEMRHLYLENVLRGNKQGLKVINLCFWYHEILAFMCESSCVSFILWGFHFIYIQWSITNDLKKFEHFKTWFQEFKT